MTTLSVPLPSDMSRGLEDLVKAGIASTKAEAARHAIQRYLEDQAVQAVLKASGEPSLHGNLDELAQKL
jgi:Arc/MetJ-type ribon-helix-helix transcriptional regulator